jgi:4-hydroxybenzoate polyprenyltransferase
MHLKKQIIPAATNRGMFAMNRPYSILNSGFWRSYWITLRPYLFFISGIAGLYGISTSPSPLLWKAILGGTAFFLTYGLGQALTDVFQTDTDALSSPYRPMVQGLITQRQVFVVSMTGLLGCVAIFMVLNPWLFVPGLLGVAGLILYTFFKRRWWGGPFWNAWIVAMLPVMGKMVHTPAFRGIFNRDLLLGIGSIFFSYAVFVLSGYLKDISADRETGYNTIPVRFGWKPAVVISLFYGTAASVFSSLILKSNGAFEVVSAAGAGRLVIWMAGIIVLFLAHIQFLTGNEDEKKAHGGIANVVRAFILIHTAECLVFKPSMLIPGLLYYGLFEFVLFIRPEKTQV